MKIKDDFLRQSGVMLLAMGMVNFFNLLFHLFMVRNLITIDYGILNSLFAMFLIITVPTATIQAVVAKFVSHLYAFNKLEEAKILIRHLGLRVLAISFAAFLIIMMSRNYLAGFFQLQDNKLITVLGIALALAIIQPVFLGGLQGLQGFGFIGLSMITANALKLALGVTLVLFGFRVMGAFGALLAGGIIQTCLTFGFLKRSLKAKGSVKEENFDFSEEARLSKIYSFFLPVALAYLCLTILVNSDVILVKHFFNPLDAGYYSVASMVGKMIFFLPGAISVVMFPKTSKLHAEAKSSADVFKKSLLYSGLLCIIVGLAFIFYPILLIKLLSVKETAVFIPLSRLFVIAMSCFALVYIIVHYNLSIHRFKFLYALVTSVLLQVILIWLFHDNLIQVLSIVTVNACLLFSVNLYMVRQTIKLQTRRFK